MKKILFISNISNKITNFTRPSLISSQSLGYEFHLAANCSSFSDDASKNNVIIHHIDIERYPFNLKNIIAFKQMLRLIEKEKFDVIHCNTPIGGVLGRLCGKKARVPKVIYTAHGFHFYKGASLINRTILKWAEMWMARYTDAIITMNEEDYQAAQKFKLRKNGKVYYVPGVGVNKTQIAIANSKRKELIEELGINNNSILIISIGELNSNKNNELVIRALLELKDNNIHYIVCGKGNQLSKLKKLYENTSIQNNIHFLGFRNDIFELLKSVDIFTLTSYREGLSRSIMEAMASSLPCIVSNIRGNRDLIVHEKGGYLVDPSDVSEYCTYLQKLAQNRNLRECMGKHNFEYVEKFTFENVCEVINQIYYHELTK